MEIGAKSTLSFPIVGVGASAGGLEAFSALLHALPQTLDMAYVLVQHLDPTHESTLASLLAGVTSMPVHEIGEITLVEPNHVYVIRPNTELHIEHSNLMPRPYNEHRGSRNSIDTFFLALAKSLHHLAIGVILSGTASDGTRGLQAIKAQGGMTFAQDEHTSAFFGMPHSAILAGYVDWIGSPEGIAQELTRISTHPALPTLTTTNTTNVPIVDDEEHEFQQILQVLFEKTYVDFTNYKPTTLRRRIQRRMELQHSETLFEYLIVLRENTSEVDALFQDMLISVTEFFRTPAPLELLVQEVLPRLVATKSAHEPLRMWVPACSTGEEVYSLAITVQEFLSKHSLTHPLQIFGTDLNSRVISRARLGRYPLEALRAVSEERRTTFFVQQTNGSMHVSPLLRDCCVFAQHNLLSDPPFSRLDLISCQHLLIYLEPLVQQQVIRVFHYALLPHGMMLLGPAETIGISTDLFAPLGKKHTFYMKKNAGTRLPFVGFSHRRSAVLGTSGEEKHTMQHLYGKRSDVQQEADRLLLARYAPASVVIDAEMEILHVRGHTSPYLEAASGKASLNLFKMAREGLSLALRTALHTAKKSGSSVKKEGIQLSFNGQKREVTIEVIPLKAALEGSFLIVFEEAQSSPTLPDALAPLDELQTEGTQRRTKDRLHIQHLEDELVAYRTDMGSVLEELETANAERQATNEEILSSNEELQSLNEELETSKEEIQASNEELLTINQELRQRNEELNTARTYANAIVETVREPLVILDADLCVLQANHAFYTFFQETPEATEQHYLYDIGSQQWNIPRLRVFLDDVLTKNHVFQDFEVEHLFPSLGHKFLLLNGRRLAETMKGEPHILLAFEDITERQELERQKDAFLGVASHELRTPVTSLRAYAQLLNRRFNKAGDEQATTMFEHLESQVNRLTRLMNQLLDATQMQKGTLSLQVSVFDMNALVQEVVEDMQQTIHQHQIHIYSTISTQVSGDRERLGRVLTNLLSNAAKYSPNATIIVVRLGTDNDAVTLSVQDSGMGIPIEKQAFLFQRFYRANDVATVPGLGLGLYISAEIIKQHSGRMWVESIEGVGSTFFIRFPLLPQPV